MKYAGSMAFGVGDVVDGGVFNCSAPSAGIVFNRDTVGVVGRGCVVRFIVW